MKVPGKLNHWQTALLGSPEGRQVWENITNDDNVPKPIQKDVHTHLLGLFPATQSDPLAAFDQALERVPKSACAGPDARPPAIALLTRFTPLRYVLNQPEARRRALTAPRVRNKPSLLRGLTSISLGCPPRLIVWAAWEDPVSFDLRAGFTLAAILNKLGVRVSRLWPMVRITYSSDDVPDTLRVPTVFDAGSYDPFRPQPANSPCGMTHPCDGAGTGYEEYVHKGCTVAQPKLDLHDA